jgi:ABC-type Fe3+ transport system permease subunit
MTAVPGVVIAMNLFYVVEIINELMMLIAGTTTALVVLTYIVFCFPKDES